MANLELTDEEVEDSDPKVHGVLSWMGKLNEVDLAAVESQVDLYRDTWRMPLREDVEVDFDNRDAMFAECKTWRSPTSASARWTPRRATPPPPPPPPKATTTRTPRCRFEPHRWRPGGVSPRAPWHGAPRREGGVRRETPRRR